MFFFDFSFPPSFIYHFKFFIKRKRKEKNNRGPFKSRPKWYIHTYCVLCCCCCTHLHLRILVGAVTQHILVIYIQRRRRRRRQQQQQQLQQLPPQLAKVCRPFTATNQWNCIDTKNNKKNNPSSQLCFFDIFPLRKNFYAGQVKRRRDIQRCNGGEPTAT